MALTLAQALAELRRIGPVYDAAVRCTRGDLRYADDPVNQRTIETQLAAAVKAANPGGLPVTKSEQLASGSWWPGTDWATYAQDP